MQKADSWGRPWYALVPTLVIGGGMSYINVSYTGAQVFGWFSNLTSLLTLFGWGMICLSHIRMRHAWKIQGRSVDELPWKTWTWPWGAYWGLAWYVGCQIATRITKDILADMCMYCRCIILIIAEFYLAVWPLGSPQSAEHFFSVYVSVIAVVVLYVGAKIYYRNGKWVNTATIDLDVGRRFYKDYEMEHAMAKNQNFLLKGIKGIWS